MTSDIGVSNDNPYDVIVCGAGHAGCEAALVSSRMNRNATSNWKFRYNRSNEL